MVQLILHTLSLFSGIFCFGGIVLLYIEHATKMLRMMLLFILSLVLISLGFWLQKAAPLFPTSAEELFKLTAALSAIPGLILNIYAVPRLAMAVTLNTPGKGMRSILGVWTSLALLSGILYGFLPDPSPVSIWLNIELLVTIFLSLLIIVRRGPSLSDGRLKKSVYSFLIASALFLVLLTADILVSRLGISVPGWIDNSSLPIYLMALNAGMFVFSGRFLRSDPLLEGGSVTDYCKDKFGLTDREVQIIEQLQTGSTNRELADVLFISVKTVENHLYNIYQKIEVKNRMQLITTLQNLSEVKKE